MTNHDPRVTHDEILALRRERERLWKTLQAQGGRGVELAERIDEIDATLEDDGSPNERARIAAALTRVRRACDELTEAEQDFPPFYGGLREIVRQANNKLDGMAAMVGEQYGLADTLITRWNALKPRVEAIEASKPIAHDDLTEAIAVAQAMDGANDARYDEAREWFRTNGLPTTWRPSART